VLKLRGRARLAWRRLRTPKGFVFGVVGALLFALWVGALVLRLTFGDGVLRQQPALGQSELQALAQLAVTAYGLFAITANLSWRGLYLPRAELERLFSAPVTRRDLVRYRLLGMAVPSLFVAALVGVMASARVPTPLAGFLGGALTVGLATVLGQGVALVAAHEGGPLGRTLERLPGGRGGGLPRLVGALGLAAVLLLLLFGEDLVPARGYVVERGGQRYEVELAGPGAGGLDVRDPRGVDVSGALGRITAAARHPVAQVLTAPAYPLARVIVAPSLSAALPFFALALLLLALAFELVVRLPVDYREASLATSRDVERRLARLRRGQLGPAGGEPTTLRGWRVPWVFGTGPFGAVLWLKLATLLRQGRSALALATLTAALGVVVGVMLLPDPGIGTGATALLGVTYLASGLRFDFRAELDRLTILRAWPLAPWQLFLAVIGPVTLFVALFVAVVLAIRAVLLDADGKELTLALAATPLVAYLWIALDNAVFLLFPVRFVPGQGGALQHSGRALLMVLLRLVLLTLTGGAAAAAAVAASFVAYKLGLGPAVIEGSSWAAAGLTLFGAAALLAVFGGFALRRYDPTS